MSSPPFKLRAVVPLEQRRGGPPRRVPSGPHPLSSACPRADRGACPCFARRVAPDPSTSSGQALQVRCDNPPNLKVRWHTLPVQFPSRGLCRPPFKLRAGSTRYTGTVGTCCARPHWHVTDIEIIRNLRVMLRQNGRAQHVPTFTRFSKIILDFLAFGFWTTIHRIFRIRGRVGTFSYSKAFQNKIKYDVFL